MDSLGSLGEERVEKVYKSQNNRQSYQLPLNKKQIEIKDFKLIQLPSLNYFDLRSGLIIYEVESYVNFSINPNGGTVYGIKSLRQWIHSGFIEKTDAQKWLDEFVNINYKLKEKL